jgi:hypothetical protein
MVELLQAAPVRLDENTYFRIPLSLSAYSPLRIGHCFANAARQLGIFGSPTFAIGAELFWGDDRLEDALTYATVP